MPRGGPDWGFLAPQKSLMQLLREQNHFYVNASTAGAAGKYTTHQLYNPADSLVDAFIVAFGHVAEVACDGRMGWDVGSIGALENYGRNRYSGGTQSEIEVRWDQRATAVYVNEMWRGEVLTTFSFVDQVYLWLKPGYGLRFILLTADLDLQNIFMWYEFPSTEV